MPPRHQNEPARQGRVITVDDIPIFRVIDVVPQRRLPPVPPGGQFTGVAVIHFFPPFSVFCANPTKCSRLSTGNAVSNQLIRRNRAGVKAK